MKPARRGNSMSMTMTARRSFQVTMTSAGRVFSSPNAVTYIERMMAYLESGPSLLDKIMAHAASASLLADDVLPEDEIGCFFRWSLAAEGGLEPALGELIRRSLTATDEAHAIRRMQQHAREKLQPYVEKSLWHTLTGGIEDVNRIERPCRVLLERYNNSETGRLA